ncbi:MAG: radical SAM family heme chaperone HemW [Candidatus Saganbacteria bacterium]|nr:radical SAM family heme chaperone HemW [Candidatus Saganbacteria bacterium]
MTSLYIHIPFCKKKCNYCDFVSYAGAEDLIDKYVAALCKEINNLLTIYPERTLSEERSDESKGSRGTIYIGGGTPTLLSPRQTEKILCSVVSVRCSEISIEANPGTCNKAKLKELRQLGINRLSIGAQSFNDNHLKTLGRIHNAKDIFGFYDDARAAGFDNINLDLIFALPNQTLDEWKKDVEIALSLAPEHLSTYNLQVEKGTPIWEMTKIQAPNNKLQLPTEDEELAMYEYTIETLISKGYKHYEISNFAKPGFECKHNLVYWKNGNYLGVGAGAHSHINGQRFANSNDIDAYMRQVLGEERNEIRNALRGTPNDSHVASAQRETIFMGLRLLDGIPTEKFRGFEKEVAELIEDGLLMREKGNYKLTRKGLYLANLVFEKFV